MFAKIAKYAIAAIVPSLAVVGGYLLYKRHQDNKVVAAPGSEEWVGMSIG